MPLIHGLYRHPLYSVWKGMRQRCNDSAHPAFRNYGGRGIRVCARWDDFTLFLADVGERPAPNMTLDRRDNDGDYTPENCRWATRVEQRANSRQDPVSEETRAKNRGPHSAERVAAMRAGRWGS